MLPGPVFAMELLTTARRRRYYVLRTAYAAAILGFMLMFLGQISRVDMGSEMSFRQVAELGVATFTVVAYAEILAILGLTPVLVAGVIADETQRKTLHFVLSTPLPSSEIVLGKMLSRLLHVAVFIAIIIPVLALLSLAGGVDPALHWALILGSFSAAFLLASISLLASTLARRVRDAVFLAYAAEGLWLFAAPFCAWLVSTLPPTTWNPLREGLQRGLSLLWAMHPITVLGRTDALDNARNSAFFQAVWTMVELQTCLGLFLTTIAVFQLRPAFRRREAKAPGVRGAWRWAFPKRFRRSRSIGEWPMLWKERGAKSRGAVRAIIVLLGGGLFLFTGYVLMNVTGPLFREMWFGERIPDQFLGPRFEVNLAIRSFGTLWGALLMMGAAGIASSSITSEKEEDTWTNLMTSCLTSREILIGKGAGAICGVFFPAMVLSLIVLTGLLCGALHPIAAFGFSCILLIYTVFSTSLGLYISLVSRTTWRAQASVQGILIALGFGLFCCFPLFMSAPWLVVVSPLITMGASLSSGTDIILTIQQSDAIMPIYFGILGLFAYAGAAYTLWTSSLATLQAERGDNGRRPERHRTTMLDHADTQGIEFLP